MKNVALALFSFTLSLAVMAALLFGLRTGGLAMMAYFAPREAAIEREVFENTKAYNDGMVRDLENIMMEYNKATAEQKDALRSVAIHRFSVYPQFSIIHIFFFGDRLSPELRSFYLDLKNKQ